MSDIAPEKKKKKKKKPRKLPRILSDREIELLYSVIPKKSFTGVRNRSAINLMLYGGMRVSEVCDLKISNFYWADPQKELDGRDNSTILILGKGDKERKIGIPKNIRADLGLWQELRPKEAEYFLCTHAGKRLTRNYLYAAIKRYVARALFKAPEIERESLNGLKNLHPHILRHTIATKMQLSGVPLTVIKEFLGHSSISTTMIYQHVSSSDVISAQNKFFEQNKQ